MAEPTKLPVKTESKVPAPAFGGAWAPFDALRREIDQVFETFGLGALRLPLARSVDAAWPREMGWSLAPAVDVVEKGKEYEITAELPGLDEKDVEVKVANGTLTIKGEKRETREEREKDYFLSERRYGSFLRSFRVPEGVSADKIDATFAKGVLTVKLPKTVEAQAETTVPVKAA